MAVTRRKKLKTVRDKTTMEVAHHFEVSVLTVNNWKKNGCPFSTIPMPGETGTTRKLIQYNFDEVAKWYKNNVRVGRPKNGTC